MAGFKPVGSTPVDAIGASGLTGTYFQPAQAVIYLGSAGAPVSNSSPLKIAGINRETLLAGTAKAKMAGMNREVLLAGTAKAKIAALYREVLRSGGSGPTGDNCFVSIIWGQ